VNALKVVAGVLSLSMVLAAHADGVAAKKSMMKVQGGTFQSVIPVAPGKTQVEVRNFFIDATPVTNADFAAFLAANPKWRRGKIPALLADNGYLSHWRDGVSPAEKAQQPVTHVSWYVARAYCEARNARLPTWYEWEWVAAASATQADARNDPAWRKQMLDWYARPSGELPDVGLTKANRYGVRDLHGVIWEWVEDFNGMLLSADSREQGDPDVIRFCGSGAVSMEQKDQYAILMRIAMLSSMQARYTSATMGFRCATEVNP
jgi:sulfatase modifying factor 1